MRVNLSFLSSAVFWMLLCALIGSGLIVAATVLLAGIGWALAAAGFALLGLSGAIFRGISNG